MNRKQRAQLVAKTLEKYFPDVLPPLLHQDPYTLLIAVLLSGHSTDRCVNRVTPRLFALADSPQKMALITPQTIEEIIRPCGLSKRKSIAIHTLSKQLLEKHRGKVPSTLEELTALAGVGRKTALVVLAQAFDHNAFPVDTHIHRCAKRWGLSNGKTVRQTEEDLKTLFPKKSWKKRHLQIILFARTYCKARQHDGKRCPICSQLQPIFRILGDAFSIDF